MTSPTGLQAARERLEAWASKSPRFLRTHDIRTVLAALDEAENEIAQLRLAICGGEDAPGYAGSLPLSAILQVAAENMIRYFEAGAEIEGSDGETLTAQAFQVAPNSAASTSAKPAADDGPGITP